jgi:hypothetical protein
MRREFPGQNPLVDASCEDGAVVLAHGVEVHTSH